MKLEMPKVSLDALKESEPLVTAANASLSFSGGVLISVNSSSCNLILHT